MSLFGDIIDRVLFPNREIHVIPVLDGAFSPNQRLDQARQLGGDIERPNDIAHGPDGALYVSTESRILRCTGAEFDVRETFATLEGEVGGLAWTAARLRFWPGARRFVVGRSDRRSAGECGWW